VLLDVYARGVPGGRTGSVTVLQRADSGLNVHLHFHTLVPLRPCSSSRPAASTNSHNGLAAGWPPARTGAADRGGRLRAAPVPPALSRVAERDGQSGTGSVRPGGVGAARSRRRLRSLARCARHSPWSWVYYLGSPLPRLDDPVLYVRDLGEERNKQLIRFLPDRAPHWMGMHNGQLVLVPVAR